MRIVVLAIVVVFGCKAKEAAPVAREDAQRVAQMLDAIADTATVDAPINPTRGAAHEAWREGRLVAARHGYQDLCQRDPNDWRACAAVASMVLPFGKLSVEAAKALLRDELSPAAKAHVRALIDATENADHEKLNGTLASWDIEALRLAGKKESFGWWLKKGETASRAWLFGLALACFEEACNRFDALRDDPPGWAQKAPRQTDDYLNMFANALP